MQSVRLVALMTLLLAAPALAQDKVELKVVKYDDLTKLVKDARGKVVIVELWQDG